MKWIVPDFYFDFKCVGGSYIDNCCIGWEIDIDEDTAEFYQNVTGDFGNRMKENIEWSDTPHFILGEKERCPFLNERDLCDIYTHLGEEHLCEICREHPRFHEWFGDRKESGIGLCCPEATKLLLKEDTPLRFVDLDDGVPEEEIEDEEWQETVLSRRQTMYDILQDRSLPISDRLTLFYNTACESPLPLPTEEQLLEYAKSLEPINEEWTELLQKAECANDAASPLPNWVQEKAAVYLTFRWIGKAVYDYDLSGKAEFIVRFMGLLNLFVRRSCVKNAEEGLRILSKEMEYLE